MCGIIGFRYLPDNYEDIVMANSKRGGYSFGILSYWLGKPEYLKVLHDKWQNFWYLIKRTPNFMQFRAPTTGEQDRFVVNENYPLVYKKDGLYYYLFGNGVTSDEWFRSIKDETNNNDLYYIGKKLINDGWDFLSEVQGTFALVLVVGDGMKIRNVYMMRNVYPLYYNEDVYSSVKFDGMKPLKNGIIYDWWNDIVVGRFEPYEVPLLVDYDVR